MEVIETVKIPHWEITKKLGIAKVWKELEKLTKKGEIRLINKDNEWIELSRPRINALYYTHLNTQGFIDKIIIW